MTFQRPEYLVETDWLAGRLEDPAVRVVECTVFLYPRPTAGFRAESGRAAWAQGHIPGSEVTTRVVAPLGSNPRFTDSDHAAPSNSP